MKKILALTDLSANAAHAAENAVNLAGKLGIGVILSHANVPLALVPDYAGTGFTADTINVYNEESRQQLDKLAAHLNAQKKYNVTIETHMGEGWLGSDVEHVALDQDIDLVVMGAPAGGLVDHLLTGSETRDVLKTTKQPVMIIPADSNVKNIKNIVFATDYNPTDICALRYLSKWVSIMGCKLDVIHIDVANEPDKTPQKHVFETYLVNLQYPGISCRDLRGKDVLKRIESFCKNTDADLLAVVNYHNGFFTRLFGGSHTLKVLENLQMPLLVFPRTFCDENMFSM